MKIVNECYMKVVLALDANIVYLLKSFKTFKGIMHFLYVVFVVFCFSMFYSYAFLTKEVLHFFRM